MSASSIVEQTADQREAERRASYVAQLRRAADLIEQFELPVGYVDIMVPIMGESEDEKDAILTAAAARVGMQVDRSTPSCPEIKLKLGDGGIYRIYYSSKARRDAYAEASKAMVGWDKGLDEPADAAAEITGGAE